MAEEIKESAKQEISISVGGKIYSVRPDFETIANIEIATDQAARALGMKALAAGIPQAQRGGLQEIKLSEMAIVIFHMIRGKKGAPDSPASVGALLMDDGYGDLLQPVGMFLVRAQRGNKEHEKEATQEKASEDPPQTAERT